MKTKCFSLLVGIFFIAATLAPAATNDLSSALQKGLFEEEANHNLDAAIAAYQTVATQFDKDRKLAATAIFRLGEVYRKQGKTNEATAQYERIIREFSDQPELVKLSRQYLATSRPQQTRESISPVDQIRANIARLQPLVAAIEAAPATNRIEYLETFFTNQELLEPLINQRNGLRKQIEFLLKSKTEENPDVIYAKAQVKTVQKQIENQIEKYVDGTKSSLVRFENDLKQWSNSETNILVADAEEKEIQRIKAMIKDSPDLINASQGSSGIPLHLAAQNGWLRAAEFLLANGADVNRKSGNQTALLSAVQYGRKPVIELLIANGADLEVKGSTGGTALHVASQIGFKAIAEILLAHKADVNAKNSTENRGETPLHLAAAAGHKAVAELLLANGANVNVKNDRDQTPLFSAILAKNLEMAKFLIANNADVNAKNNGGGTPLFAAIDSKDVEMARFLIGKKADVNAVSKNTLTPLYAAVLANEPKFVELLLQNGANTELKYKEANYKGWTPLQLAAFNGRKELVEMLLKKGANPNSTDEMGFTPLHYTAGTEIAELLLANKADPNIQAKSSETPLGFAKRRNSPAREELVALLLKYGANENFERLTRISTKRAGKETSVFIKGNQPLNRYTIIELIVSAPLPFPDLVNVKIDRLEEGGKKSRIIPVDLEEVLESGDCSKNLWLEWGDVVEIPELDHRVNESWSGYRKEYAETMQKCLERKISISVKGVTTNLVLRAGISHRAVRDGKPDPNSWNANWQDWTLGQVVNPFLRASSDRSRIKVKRIDPVTRQSHEIIDSKFGLNAPDALWLIDGDQIEIPERDPNSPAPAVENLGPLPPVPPVQISSP